MIRLRKGWYAIHTIRPIERRAIIDRGLLTCASAAEILGLPVKESHYHLRTARPNSEVKTNCRRRTPTRVGARVPTLDWLEDYLHCQDPDWSLAVLDAVFAQNLLSAAGWSDLENRLSTPLRKLCKLRSRSSESPLESLLRFRLITAGIAHSMQVEFGRFRADFVVSPSLIIETHGAAFHSSKEDWERDRERVLWFKNHGWDVLEVSFKQVIEWTSIERQIRLNLASYSP